MTHYTGIGSEIREGALNNATQSYDDSMKPNYNGLKFAYDYRAFGEQVDLARSMGKVTETFTGKEKDDETELSYFGARYLDQMLGVWIAVDPYREFYHSYAYSPANPINGFDNDGRIWKTVNVSYHTWNNIYFAIINRMANVSSVKGPHGTMVYMAANPKKMKVGNKRTITQEWVPDSENPSRDARHSLGTERQIEQMFTEFETSGRDWSGPQLSAAPDFTWTNWIHNWSYDESIDFDITYDPAGEVTVGEIESFEVTPSE